MSLAAQVYAEQLLPKGHGFPLWIPEPSSQFGEILLGDVGYIWDGSFFRLFNVTLPRGHPVNRRGVPEGFEHLEYDLDAAVRKVDRYLEQGSICSQSVKRTNITMQGGANTGSAGALAGLRFACSRDRGGLLVLNDAASQEIFQPYYQAVIDYMLQYHDSWYEFALRKGLQIPREEIIMVRGHVKTSQWAVAAFVDASRNQEIVFQAQAGPLATLSLAVARSDEHSMSVDHRSGQTRRNSGDAIMSDSEDVDMTAQSQLPSQDQCVFVSRYKIRHRKYPWRKIRAAGYKDDEDTQMDDDEQGSSLTNHRDFIESDDVQHSPADPLDDILQYILDNSECDAAIASDEDLHDINKHMELGRLPVSDFLQSSPPAVQISHNRVGSLKMPPTTLRDPPQETIPPLLSIENRSELLSQLRTRSEEIAKLMARLAEISARKEEDMQHEFPRPPHPSNNSTRGRSITSSTPPLTYRSPSVSDTVSDIASTRYSSEMDTKKRKLQPANIDVAQWIAGAQQSIEAFDAYIHMFPDDKGRAGSPMSYTPDYDFDSTSDDPAAAVYYSLSLSTGTTGPSSVQPTSSQNFASPPNPLPRGQVLRREKRHKIRKPSRPSAKGRDELHFRPKLVHPPIHENDIPHILRRGLISAAEIEQLFSIYWEYMNVSVNILDPVLYSAQQTYWRSPFLFTVICAIASRFHQARPDLYAKAMDYAQLAAGTALIGGKKSVDNVHAYLLLSLFPRPIQTRADDRSWLFVGVAIQMATDLGLHIPDKLSPKGDIHAREALNRTRAWLNCYNTDRVMSLQHCRAATINNDTYIVNHCDDFWRNSPSDMRGSDLLLSARTTLWSTASKFVEANLNGSDPASIIREVSVTEEMLTQLYTRWDEHLRAQATQLQEKRDIAQSIFMNTSLRLWYRFTRILVLSRSISGASLEFDSLPFMRYLQATLDVLTVFMEDDGESPFRLYMRHSPDLLFALLVSSCMHLLRLLSSRVEGEADMVGWVERIADVLGSPAFSVDEGHSATLLSHFLRAQLSIDAPYWTPPPAEDGSSRRMEDDPSVPVPDVFATPLYLDPNVLLAKRLIPMQRLVPDSSLLVKGEIVDRKPTF